MTFEELTLEHTKLQEQLEQTKQELESFKNNYETLSSEKENLTQEIQKLKNTNYELFERVNTKYKEIQENVVSGEKETTQKETDVTLDDVINNFI